MSDRAFLAHFDANDLVMSATAYYLGRTSISVVSHCEALINAWPQLDEHVKDYIKQIVESAIARYERYGKLPADVVWISPLGQQCDREMWLKVRQLWQAKE